MIIYNTRYCNLHSTASVYFEIYDPATKRIKQFSGTVMREECHQVGLTAKLLHGMLMKNISPVESHGC